MLPRMATQVTVPTPLSDSTTEGGQRPVLSAEALANLRAAVVLRLLEAMMRQIDQRGDKGNVAHQLLDVLFAAMKTLPPRDGKDNEPAKRLANLLSRLPAEMRPPIERLLTTALSVASTRVLMEIIRNPGGRDAQRLAQTLLATPARTPDVDRVAGRLNQRFAGLEAQLAASSRNLGREVAAGGMKPGAADGKALQAALRKMFEAGVEARPSHNRSGIEPRQTMTSAASRMPRQASAVPGTAQSAASAAQGATRAGTERLGAAPDTSDGQPLLDTDAENDHRPIGKTGPLGGSREDPAPSASTKAPAHAAPTTQESVQRLIAGLVANLTDDEALVLRLLLEAPLPEAPPGVDQTPLPEHAADDAAPDPRALDARPGATVRAGGNEPDPPGPSLSDGAGDEATPTAVPVTPHEDENAEALQPKPEQGEKLARAAANAVPQLDRPLEKLPVPLALREGIGFPVVPHQPAQDDFDSGEAVRQEKDEEEGTSDAGGENEPGEGNEDAGDEDLQTEQPADADPDLAGRRSKIAELVGPPDPGFAFYQRLGDYWT